MTTKSAGIILSTAFHSGVLLIATFMPWVRVLGNESDGFASRMTLWNIVIPNWLPFALSLVVLADGLARRRGFELMADRVPMVLALCGFLHVVALFVVTATNGRADVGIGALVAGILSLTLAMRLARDRAERRRFAAQRAGEGAVAALSPESPR